MNKNELNALIRAYTVAKERTASLWKAISEKFENNKDVTTEELEAWDKSESQELTIIKKIKDLFRR